MPQSPRLWRTGSSIQDLSFLVDKLPLIYPMGYMRGKEKSGLTGIWFMGVILALMPFFPEPHLWQKLQLLFSGYLKKPMDWVDLIFHSSGLILAAIWTIRRMMQQKRGGNK